MAQALKQTSREATILLYAPSLDPHLQKMTELADRVFCIYEGQAAPARGRAEARMPGAQATLAVSSKAMELQTAKEILAEVFRARPRRGGGDDTEEGGGAELV